MNNGALPSNGFAAEHVHLPGPVVDFKVTYSITKYAQHFAAGSNIRDERKKWEKQYSERSD